jgi:hypothetical protein
VKGIGKWGGGAAVEKKKKRGRRPGGRGRPKVIAKKIPKRLKGAASATASGFLDHEPLPFYMDFD